jgi:ATP-dependent RNA helicase RhlE
VNPSAAGATRRPARIIAKDVADDEIRKHPCGLSHRSQTRRMERGVDVLAATPGRLNDHLDEGNVVLADTQVLVLDKADQMLDLGFLPQIRGIVSRLTSKRQSLFFSATMPREIVATLVAKAPDAFARSMRPLKFAIV